MALLVLLLSPLGCGGPADPTPTPRPTDPLDRSEETVLTQAVEDPKPSLAVRVVPNPAATQISPTMVAFEVVVTANEPCDIHIPGPPHLEIRLKAEDSDHWIEPAPHPLRAPLAKIIPFSLEKGESLVLGPLNLDHLDLSPLPIREQKKYEIEVRYWPVPKKPALVFHQEAVLIQQKSLEFPLGTYGPYGADLPTSRPGVPLVLLDARQRPRRYFHYSPDTGLSLVEDESEDG